MDRSELVFYDARFRQKRKKGAWREVAAPQLPAPVADTHAHLLMLADPALALARAGFHGLRFVETITDPAEDGFATFDELPFWEAEAVRELRVIAEEAAQQAAERLEAGEVSDGIATDGTLHAGEAAAGAKECAGLSDAAGVANAAVSDTALLTVPEVRIACGVHPHNAKDYTPELEVALRDHLHDRRVSAVGEIGLDYHYDLSPREAQRAVFRTQIRLAKEAGLPICLHMREAHDEGFAILQEEGFPEAGTLLHCFNLDAAEVARWVEAGCYIAFGGPLTFKNADEVREAATLVPADRLLTETDSPYMTPEPLRGINCEPAHTVFTAEKLCEVRGVTTPEAREALLTQLYENAQRLLNRPSTPWQKEGAPCQLVQ